MNKKTLTIVVVAAVVIIGAIIVLAFSNFGQNYLTFSAPTNSSDNQTNQTNSSLVPNTPSGNSTSSAPAVISPSANLSAFPGSPEAPKQEVVTSTDKIPAKAIKIQISADGFKPKTFSVKAGQSVTLALTSTDNSAHVFIFPTASLMALTTMVLNGETKTITFDAPTAGTYSFRDDIPSFRANTGEMIVK